MKPTSDLGALLEAAGILADLFESIAEARLFLVAAVAERDGAPVSVSHAAKAIDMPFSTASRLVWNLQERGLLTIDPSATDRRVKFLHTGKAWRKVA